MIEQGTPSSGFAVHDVQQSSPGVSFSMNTHRKENIDKQLPTKVQEARKEGGSASDRCDV